MWLAFAGGLLSLLSGPLVAPPAAAQPQAFPPEICEWREDAGWCVMLRRPASVWRAAAESATWSSWRRLPPLDDRLRTFSEAWRFGPAWLVEAANWWSDPAQLPLRSWLQDALEGDVYCGGGEGIGPWTEALRVAVGELPRSLVAASESLQPWENVWLRLATLRWAELAGDLQTPRLVLAARLQTQRRDLARDLDLLEAFCRDLFSDQPSPGVAVQRYREDAYDAVVLRITGAETNLGILRDAWGDALLAGDPFGDSRAVLAARDRLLANWETARLRLVVGRQEDWLWVSLEPDSAAAPRLSLPAPQRLQPELLGLAPAGLMDGAPETWDLAGGVDWSRLGLSRAARELAAQVLEAAAERLQASQAPPAHREALARQLEALGKREIDAWPELDGTVFAGRWSKPRWRGVWRTRYAASEASEADAQPLTLLRHAPPDAWCTLVWRPDWSRGYENLSGLVQLAHAHLLHAANTTLTLNEQQVLWKARQAVEPLFKSWDEVWRENFVGALQGGEFSWSLHWAHATRQPSVEFLPQRPAVRLPSVSLAATVGDMPAFQRAWGPMFSSLVACWTRLRRAFPDETPAVFSIPQADAEQPGVFWWPILPEAGWDHRARPHAVWWDAMVLAGLHWEATAARREPSEPPCGDLLPRWSEPLEFAAAFDAPLLGQEIEHWLQHLTALNVLPADSPWQALPGALRGLGRIGVAAARSQQHRTWIWQGGP